MRPSYVERAKSINRIRGIRIMLASPEQIRGWSHGEVTKPETINYRTFKPERDGLFCAKIFGPVNDWECLCGKYKRMKYRGVVCEKCGVEVIQSKVRRERMGHIELASPVCHIWFLKGTPSRIGNLLDMKAPELERILYFESYVVVDPGDTPLKEHQLLNEKEYRQTREELGDRFVAMIGAEAIKELLKRIDVEEMAEELRVAMKAETVIAKKQKLAKRLKVVDAFRKSGNKPEWMILDVLPVIPPELRPLVPLDGGRFATSDLNDLYRRVINRNNRLRKLLDMKAPEVIVRNEKRMLQEAVDALFDNGRRGRVLRGTNNRPLKSLSDTLKGKQGRFRQNLLGKRVDYSGRSVIVVGPDLKINQCGLPKLMAIELFMPFIYHRLEELGLALTIKQAKELVETHDPVVYDVLSEVIQKHPVLLNRAPTLHRLGIQAFEPVLIEGKAIQLHPLCCTAFNADFDGDQMAVHVPLSPGAQIEASVLMLSGNNLLYPANGVPIIVPTQDIVLGIYYLTGEKSGVKKGHKMFSSLDEVRLAYVNHYVGLHTPIKLRFTGEVIDLTSAIDDQAITSIPHKVYKNDVLHSTVGRVIFNSGLPDRTPFINGILKKKGLKELFTYCFNRFGNDHLAKLADCVKELGFKFSTQAGISFGFDDMVVAPDKEKILKDAEKRVVDIEEQYQDGAITNRERYNKVLDIWNQATDKVADSMFKAMKQQEEVLKEFNPIYIMAESGARGSKQQIRQLAGMRGLMAKPSGEIIEQPITANFREGLSVLQYFISTHGARKGLADTALKTADAGYLTRRLVDVAQDVIITEEDCHTLDGIVITPLIEAGRVINSLKDRIVGRVALDDSKDPFTREIIVKANEEINEVIAQKIQDAGIEKVKIRSVLTCETSYGVCSKCYGRNLASGKLAELGEAVGIMAAQSIGEPGTQLTMRTFHIGGTASKEAVESTHTCRHDGIVRFEGLVTIKDPAGDLLVMNRIGTIVIFDTEGREKERYPAVYGAKLKVSDGQKIKKSTILAEWDPYTNPILSDVVGIVHFKDIIDGVTVRDEMDTITGTSQRVIATSPDPSKEPQILIRPVGKKSGGKSFPLPAGAHLMAEEGQEVWPGTYLVKIPRESSKTKDIVGGLPRVVELFEARKPKNPAVITEVDGVVRYGEVARGMRRIYIDSLSGETREYTVPKGIHINVLEGEHVKAGDPLIEGPIDPHDILRVLGIKELQRYLVNEIQEVYRLQGVTISDKHIEVISRQMIRWIRVEEVGDTSFLVNQQVDRFEFAKENERVLADGGSPAKARPHLLGITKAALATNSWISAASFQETTRVLTEASVNGATDYLRGLKENVIMGRLIPAGTGFKTYHGSMIEVDPTIKLKEEEEAGENILQEMAAETMAMIKHLPEDVPFSHEEKEEE